MKRRLDQPYFRLVYDPHHRRPQVCDVLLVYKIYILPMWENGIPIGCYPNVTLTRWRRFDSCHGRFAAGAVMELCSACNIKKCRKPRDNGFDPHLRLFARMSSWLLTDLENRRILSDLVGSNPAPGALYEQIVKHGRRRKTEILVPKG